MHITKPGSSDEWGKRKIFSSALNTPSLLDTLHLYTHRTVRNLTQNWLWDRDGCTEIGSSTSQHSRLAQTSGLGLNALSSKHKLLGFIPMYSTRVRFIHLKPVLERTVSSIFIRRLSLSLKRRCSLDGVDAVRFSWGRSTGYAATPIDSLVVKK